MKHFYIILYIIQWWSVKKKNYNYAFNSVPTGYETILEYNNKFNSLHMLFYGDGEGGSKVTLLFLYII